MRMEEGKRRRVGGGGGGGGGGTVIFGLLDGTEVTISLYR